MKEAKLIVVSEAEMQQAEPLSALFDQLLMETHDFNATMSCIGVVLSTLEVKHVTGALKQEHFVEARERLRGIIDDARGNSDNIRELAAGARNLFKGWERK